MSIWFSLFIADFINNIMLSIYTLKNAKSKPFKFYVKYFIIILFVTIVTNIMIDNSSQMAKTIIKLLLLSFLVSLLEGETFSKTLMKVFLISILFMILDCVFGLLYAGVLGMSPQSFQKNAVGILSVNFIMAISTYIILINKKIDKFIENLSSLYSRRDTLNMICNIILCIFALWFFMKKTTSGETTLYNHITNLLVIGAVLIFVIGFFKEKYDRKKIVNKYDQLLEYAKTYEQEVVEKSKWQHEYQNQLIIVKSKISKNNKEAQKYIDDLLQNQPIDVNSQWLSKLSNFPDIGIKGLFYYKIGQMQSKGINVFVDVSEELELKKFHYKLLENNLQDISRVLGVYLDNAIEAASKAGKKYIVLEINCDKNKLVFEISNTYAGNLNFEKIDDEKYTTKGKGHGYGLSLVKDILAKNNLLSQEREINGIYYVQKLIIDIKK